VIDPLWLVTHMPADALIAHIASTKEDTERNVERNVERIV
jgi:hypothetical protein